MHAMKKINYCLRMAGIHLFLLQGRTEGIKEGSGERILCMVCVFNLVSFLHYSLAFIPGVQRRRKSSTERVCYTITESKLFVCADNIISSTVASNNHYAGPMVPKCSLLQSRSGGQRCSIGANVGICLH